MKVDKKKFTLLISLGLSCLLLYSLYLEGFDSLVDKIHGIDKPLLFLYIFLNLLSLLLRALRYKLVFSSFLSSAPSLNKMLVTTGVRNGFVDFLPARLGELSFFYILKKYNIKTSSITTVFGLCTAIDIVVLFFIVFLACFYSFDQSLLSIEYAPLFLVISILLLFAIKKLDFFLTLFSLSLSRWRKNNKATAFLQRVADDLKTIKESDKYFQILLLTFVLRIFKYTSLYILLLSVVKQFGFNFDELNPLITSVSFICAEASASLPISGFMGFGAYEGVWQMVFNHSLVKISSLSSVIFLVHIISQVVGYFIAIICLLTFGITQARLNKS